MSEVWLKLQSSPESVSLLRAAASGFVTAEGFPDGQVNAVRTAVSEAVTNVVVHAYDGSPGPAMLVLRRVEEGVEVLVQDQGRGFGRINHSEERMGLGLPVISALADRAEFGTAPGGGAEVRLLFATDSGRPVNGSSPAAEPPEQIDGEIVGSLWPGQLLNPVLGPVVRALAARFNFSVDRIRGLRGVTDALAAQIDGERGEIGLFFALTADNRLLDLRIGPFPQIAGRLASLPEKVGEQSGPDGSYVRLVVGEAR